MIWFLFLLILFFFLTLRQGKQIDDKSSSYVPNPNGHWVNNGTTFDEQWEWWEPDEKKVSLFVSVHNDDSGYKIVISDQSPSNEIEFMNCEDKREAEITVSLFTAFYSVLGSVTISDLVGIDLNKDMNGGCI